MLFGGPVHLKYRGIGGLANIFPTGGEDWIKAPVVKAETGIDIRDIV